MHKLFNAVLQLEIYPKEWKMGYTTPIFKSGDRFDSSNYRGITIMSCVGKFFNSILNHRYISQRKQDYQ